MPNGTYGGVRGWGRKAPAYSMIFPEIYDKPGKFLFHHSRERKENNANENIYYNDDYSGISCPMPYANFKATIDEMLSSKK